MKNILRKIVKFLIGCYCIIVYRVKTFGLENIPKEGGVIFCGNHRSYLDPVLIILKTKRYLRFMAKEELKNNFIFKWLFPLFDVIYVKRNSKDIGPLKEALKTLKNGDCIGIFPEGTRNGLEKNDGQIKDGAAYLALKTGAKLVPIGICRTSETFS